MEMKSLLPLSLLLASVFSSCSSKGRVPETVGDIGYIFGPGRQNLGTLNYPGTKRVRFTFRNISKRTITLRGISGSCSCQAFSVGDDPAPNTTSGLDLAIAPGETKPVAFTATIRPGLQNLQIRVHTDQKQETMIATVVYYGEAAVKLLPPEHHFGSVSLNSVHKWETRIASTDATPFELRTSDRSLKLTPEPFYMAWKVSGEVKAEKQGTTSMTHRVYTTLSRVPEITISVSAEVQRKVDLPPVVTLAVGDDGAVDYSFAPVYHDNAFSAKKVVVRPPVPGLMVKLADNRAVRITGKPVLDKFVRSSLVFSFPGGFPDQSVKMTILNRRGDSR